MYLSYLVACEVELVPESEHEEVIGMDGLLPKYLDHLDDLAATFRGIDVIFQILEKDEARV